MCCQPGLLPAAGVPIPTAAFHGTGRWGALTAEPLSPPPPSSSLRPWHSSLQRRTEMTFPVGQMDETRPLEEQRPAAEPLAGAAWLMGPHTPTRRLIRPARPRGPFRGPDPRLCLTDDLSCRQSIGSSSRGERRTKRALWRGRPLARRVRRRDPPPELQATPPGRQPCNVFQAAPLLPEPGATLACPGGPSAPLRSPLGPRGGETGGAPAGGGAGCPPVPAEEAGGGRNPCTWCWLRARGRCCHLITSC